MPKPIDPNSPFGAPPESWSDEEEPVYQAPMPQAPKEPALPEDKMPTPDEDAEGLASQWVGQMTRIGPDLYIEDKTASLLTALHALGLPMGSPKEILFIASLFTDDTVLLDEVSWFDVMEWNSLLEWLEKLPSKIGYTASMGRISQVDNSALELLKSLADLQFEIAPGSEKTLKLLKLISGSHSQSSVIAQQILALPPDQLTKLIGDIYGELEENPVRTPTVNKPPSTELNDHGMKSLTDLMRGDPDLDVQGYPQYSKKPHKQLPKVTPELAPVPLPVPAAPVAPGISAPPPPAATPVSPTGDPEFVVEPTPAQANGAGAIAKSKGIADFATRYEDALQSGIPPSVKPIPYGGSEVVSTVGSKQQRQPLGMKVWPAAGGKEPSVMVTGGMFIKEFEDVNGSGQATVPGRDAMVIGLSDDGRLAVRTFPDGKFELWDAKKMMLRLSNLKAPKRDY